MPQTRRLAAIMFADIVGYTAMMQRDEGEGLMKVQRFSQVMEQEVKAHQGEVLQFLGDGCLCIFQSAVEAMHAARAIQQSLQEPPVVPLRIGIHIGDIVIKDGNIYGDGVNLASRVESMGVPGSILVTERVIHDVKSHPEFLMASLGKFQFKNVTQPMEVFALASEGFPVPKKGDLHGKLEQPASRNFFKWLALAIVGVTILVAGLWVLGPGGNQSSAPEISHYSVAVLPFANTNKDEEGELFCDGMMDDILIYLSKIENLKVISRTSAMHFKKTTQKTPEIAAELGVAHIVEGSVRKYGNKVRITVQLIRAKDDVRIWAENYDRDLQDVFAVQSDVAKKVVEVLQVKISAAESQSLEITFHTDPEAYQLFLKGKRAADDRSREGLARSVEQLKEAIALDPTFADAYAHLAFSIFLQGRYGYSDKDSSNATSEGLAQKALSFDGQNPVGQQVLGGIYHVRGELERAKAIYDQALRQSPNNALSHHALGQYYESIGAYEKEMIHRKKAVELDPMLLVYHRNYLTVLIHLNQTDPARAELVKTEKLFPESVPQLTRFYGLIFLQEKNYRQAIPYLKKAAGDYGWLKGPLGFAYARSGNPEKARSMLDALRKEKDDHGLAIVFAGLNIADSTLYYLRLETGQPGLEGIDKLNLRTSLTHDVYFEDIRQDPRFAAVVTKLD